ncbi:alpha/beta fold hydrolase [Sphingomonas lacunae]|uniref:Alpha/beta fold hydrolase n=1 Tax=Sphingomonas lacunae TaxID=2698828 RepID=A0A6M4ASN3_9SPHN|nr:alpha/beta fold hydrolase [Sphingomonas lacunae]QJQ32064.1 alpha/beta fold hydrolase [Sphingomonas lacunae]
MRITRHYLTVKGRRVHYRRCGEGPPVLLVHQSPRSSREYEAVMRQWGRQFTCLAPDSPGFGQSDPFSFRAPTTEDYADAVLDFAKAVGLSGIAAYGFHSGGIFLMNAMRRHPERFVALAVGGYPCFRPEELADVGEAYLPSFKPMPYGEHLVWAWNRLLEQSWYFPWYMPDDRRRMSLAHADPMAVQDMVMDLLAAGDAYRDGYRAALTAVYDVPAAGSDVPPALIASYAGDPMTAHIARFPPLPDGWEAAEQPTRDAHFAVCADFLSHHPAPAADLAEDRHRGFIAVQAGRFDGLIHWRGQGDVLHLHGPGCSLDLLSEDGVMIDLPGHGLSDPWPGEPPTDWAAWQVVIDAAAAHLGAKAVSHEALPCGEAVLLFPDLTPDRYGHHLVTAWANVRASHVFAPHYAVNIAHARPIDPAAMAPERLAAEHLALIRAGTAAQALHLARQAGGIA